MTVELGKSMLLALHLGRLKDEGRITAEQVSFGKLNNIREALAIARECRTIMGAAGITLEWPMMRHANNLESVLTYEGTSEVHQLAIGQAAFSMIGGYTNAILCQRYGWDPFVAMLIGAVLAMLLAYIVAAPLLKLRGFVLAMATLALQLMLIVVAVQVAFTGGPMGVTGIPKFAVLGIPLANDRAFFWFVWLLVFIAVCR